MPPLITNWRARPRAGPLGQALGPAHRRRQPDHFLDQAELRLRAGDDQVAGERQLEGGGEGQRVGGEDDRRRQLFERRRSSPAGRPRAPLPCSGVSPSKTLTSTPPETARPSARISSARGGSAARSATAAARSSIIRWSKRFSGGLSRVRTARPLFSRSQPRGRALLRGHGGPRRGSCRVPGPASAGDDRDQVAATRRSRGWAASAGAVAEQARGCRSSCSSSTAVTPKSRLSRRTVSMRGRDRQDRHVRPVGGDEPGGAAAGGRHDQRFEAEPVDGADGALGDRVGDVLGRLVGAAEQPLAVAAGRARWRGRSGPSPAPPRPGAGRPRSPRRASPRRCRRRSRWRRRSPRPGSGAAR